VTIIKKRLQLGQQERIGIRDTINHSGMPEHMDDMQMARRLEKADSCVFFRSGVDKETGCIDEMKRRLAL